MPCDGVFVDIKKSPPENVKAAKGPTFIERYKIYKKFFESSADKRIVSFTNPFPSLQSHPQFRTFKTAIKIIRFRSLTGTKLKICKNLPGHPNIR